MQKVESSGFGKGTPNVIQGASVSATAPQPEDALVGLSAKIDGVSRITWSGLPAAPRR